MLTCYVICYCHRDRVISVTFHYFITLILTCVLGKPGSDADLQRFAGRLQYRHVSLTLNKQDLPGAAPTQEAPVLLLQLHLQSDGQKKVKFCSAQAEVTFLLNDNLLTMKVLLFIFKGRFRH